MSRLLARCAARHASVRPRVQLPQLARAASTASTKPVFSWEDPLVSKALLTEDEIAISESAERYCQEQLLPRVIRWFPQPLAYYLPVPATAGTRQPANALPHRGLPR